ncbi:hypothetical protein NM208_g1484 [Fusarium decemcellulare]|uniref:Uncharacterized protein n=1 Tax=Fusarium decemcellulare TaxID=57161 RepID=A0ACC1SW91_9HYPO|nr:hypothetical protein NM208_g1484 [Fusarium decemcellulare]
MKSFVPAIPKSKRCLSREPAGSLDEVMPYRHVLESFIPGFKARWGSEMNHQHGHKFVTDGLPISPYISFDSLNEIFLEDPPAGRLITAPTDERAWGSHEGSAAEAQDTDALMANDNNDDEEEVHIKEEAGDEKGIRNRFLRRLVCLARPPERQHTAISEYHTQASSSSRKKSKSQDTITAEELKDLLYDDSERRFSVTARAAGSEDLERAVSNYLEVIGEAYAMAYAVRAVLLFKDVRNAVIWNALGPKEVKKGLG